MERDDAEGAAAAAKYFIELYPYVMATGDTEEFEAMSHRACGFCEDALEQAERVETNDYTYVGGGSRLDVKQAYARDPVTGIFPLDAVIAQDGSQILGRDGAVVFTAEHKRFDRRIEIGRRAGAWVVVTVAPIPGAEK
nr:hypothetical protein GCM10025730_32790 [Promicromonospora thailandica]